MPAGQNHNAGEPELASILMLKNVIMLMLVYGQYVILSIIIYKFQVIMKACHLTKMTCIILYSQLV